MCRWQASSKTKTEPQLLNTAGRMMPADWVLLLLLLQKSFEVLSCVAAVAAGAAADVHLSNIHPNYSASGTSTVDASSDNAFWRHRAHCRRLIEILRSQLHARARGDTMGGLVDPAEDERTS